MASDGFDRLNDENYFNHFRFGFRGMVTYLILQLVLLIFCHFQTTSCFEYDELLQQTIDNIDTQMQMYTNSTLMNFYTHNAQGVGSQFQGLAETAAKSENPYAIAHIITYQQNYTAVQYLLETMINDTRDAVVDTFAFQRNNIGALLPMIKTTADDVYDMLTYKNCNETFMQEFYTNLITMTGYRVTMTLSEGYSAFMSQLMNTYVPFMLFSHMIGQQYVCVNPISGNQTETIDCLVHVSLIRSSNL